MGTENIIRYIRYNRVRYIRVLLYQWKLEGQDFTSISTARLLSNACISPQRWIEAVRAAIIFSTHVLVQELGSGFGLWFALEVRGSGLVLGLGTFWTGLV